MKIIYKELKQGIIKVKIDNNEDLWYLSTIIEPFDFVSGKTERKIKLGSSEEKSKIIRKSVFLKIKVEKIEFTGNSLRVLGVITEAPDDIPRGEHHTFNVEKNEVITIEKAKWLKYHLDKINEACTNQILNILVVVFDREEAYFALLKNQGYEIILKLTGDVSKKGFEESKGNFYKEIVKNIEEYCRRYELNNIIIASPSFWKEYLVKEMSDELRKKITLATCSEVDESAVNEIIKRPELKTVLEKDKMAREVKLIEEILDNVSKNNACYGIKEIENKINSGNLLNLLVSENLINEYREKKEYSILENIMKNAENINAAVNIITSKEALKKLDGIGGIAGILRWKESYE